MQVELLHGKGSSLASTLRERTERALADVAPYEHITTVTATKAEVKAEKHHPATPILRVNGFPVLPAAKEDSSLAAQGGSPTVDGDSPILASEEEIRVALIAAALTAGPSSIRLPLRHRRFIMVGAFLILAGAVSGQLLIWGPVITLIGVALLPVGFASNGRRLGRQPLMVSAGVCALVWFCLTLWYWAPILVGTSEPVVGPPQITFWLGAAFFGLAWLVVIRAVLVRRELRRELKAYLATVVQGFAPNA